MKDGLYPPFEAQRYIKDADGKRASAQEWRSAGENPSRIKPKELAYSLLCSLIASHQERQAAKNQARVTEMLAVFEQVQQSPEANAFYEKAARNLRRENQDALASEIDALRDLSPVDHLQRYASMPISTSPVVRAVETVAIVIGSNVQALTTKVAEEVVESGIPRTVPTEIDAAVPKVYTALGLAQYIPQIPQYNSATLGWYEELLSRSRQFFLSETGVNVEFKFTFPKVRTQVWADGDQFLCSGSVSLTAKKSQA